jgi:hypothetical protein
MNSSAKFLVKRGISHALLEDLRANPEFESVFRKLGSASFSVDSEVRSFRLKLKKSPTARLQIGESLWDAVLEELQEIETDLKWSKTTRGKLVLSANCYAEKLYELIRKEKAFENVFIGAHSERMAFNIVGTVKDVACLEFLAKMVAESRPDYPVEINVQVLTSH